MLSDFSLLFNFRSPYLLVFCHEKKKIWPSLNCTLSLPLFRHDSGRNPEIRRTGFRLRACRNDGAAHRRFGCGYPRALLPDFLSQKTRKSSMASIESKLKAQSSKVHPARFQLSALSFQLRDELGLRVRPALGILITSHVTPFTALLAFFSLAG